MRERMAELKTELKPKNPELSAKELNGVIMKQVRRRVMAESEWRGFDVPSSL
jgi:hypothetical protein